jgi:hypothetical protein
MKHTKRPKDTAPRRSPRPCNPDCPGWAIFDTCDGLEIQRCDECWHDQHDLPRDSYYQEHPVCIAELHAELERDPSARLPLDPSGD